MKNIVVAVCIAAFTGYGAEYSQVVCEKDCPVESALPCQLLRERIERRTPPSDHAGTLKVRFALDGSVKGENAVVVVQEGRAVVRAGRVRGLVQGAGLLLRTIRYGRQTFSLNDGEYRFEPKKSLRMGYLARHFNNWYHLARADELLEYIDDLVLMGLNAFNYQYFYPEVNLAGSTAEERATFEAVSAKMLARIRALDCGFCENGGSNQVPLDSPEEFRGVPNSDPKRGNIGFNACPSKPGGMEFICDFRRKRLKELEGLEIDYFNHWPFDEGGCECDKCRPWGGNGFLRLIERLHALNEKAHPKTKTMVSTWTFHDDDWAGLYKWLENIDWVDYILADSHREFPKYPLEHPVPKGIPIVTFPEISMWGRDPWGGYGATALPKRFARLFHQSERVTGGFMIYSEGIYEDINKWIVNGLYVDPQADPDELLRQYARYELPGANPEDFVRLCEIYEMNHLFPQGRTVPVFSSIGEDDAELAAYRRRADEADRLVEKMDREVFPAFKAGWRWRLVYLRAKIDREILCHRNAMPETARRYFEEIVKIFHAERQLAEWRKTGKGGYTSPHFHAPAAAAASGRTGSAAERAEAWSSDWIEVTAANGVKDDYYPLQVEPEKCSFRFRVMRNTDNTIGVEAFVRDDKIVVDDCPVGSISCPTWKDDCLEVFFDGDNDRNPNTRGPDWNDNPTPCNAGGEYAIAANGATQSDYASAKKCFGKLWGGFAKPWIKEGVRLGTHYRLWFTWDCLARPAPRPDEAVPLRMTVCIHDEDDGGACDYALYWKGNPKYPFADESAFGEIVLGKIGAAGR